MSAFLLFLLFLFIFFIVIPLFRVGRTVRNVRRQYREAFDSARNDSRRREAERRPGGWSAPRRRKAKVVARDEGEYVEWEEVTEVTSRTSDTSASSAAETTVRVEERITDAEWEDIK